MHNACQNSKRPSGMSLRQFLNYSLEFCEYLTMHHDIEEQRVFPLLAEKMPIFRHNEDMKNHHKQIHSGLTKLEKYVQECREGEREYRAAEMCKIMDDFNDVLWTHLDEEVVQLGAENMRKFWTLEEMNRFRF
jgi:hemerythrin-like domain-containing protein